MHNSNIHKKTMYAIFYIRILCINTCFTNKKSSFISPEQKRTVRLEDIHDQTYLILGFYNFLTL